MRATFFIVGQDLDTRVVGEDADRACAIVRQLAERGHEIANHSYSHPYELARLPPERVAEEIERAHDLLQTASRSRVLGFRAPGYDVSAAMLAQLARLGYRYDSSIFPAPAYYAAKAAIMTGLSLIGRPSGAVMTNPRALIAPTKPYRPDIRAPWRRGNAPLVELPISVTRFARMPAIGTNMLLAPAWLRTRLISAMRRQGFFNFELHGIDLADARIDEIPAALIDRQPDLRLSLAEKTERFESMLDDIQRDFDVVQLSEHAADIARST